MPIERTEMARYTISVESMMTLSKSRYECVYTAIQNKVADVTKFRSRHFQNGVLIWNPKAQVFEVQVIADIDSLDALMVWGDMLTKFLYDYLGVKTFSQVDEWEIDPLESMTCAGK